MLNGILKNIRVIDMSMGWAGPLVSMLLADFGAQVIKVEARGHLDWWRSGVSTPDTGKKPYEQSSLFNTVNRNKYGVTLELTDPRCREMLLSLVDLSDVVIENFTPRVMKNLMLGYPVLTKQNPEIIMVSMPAFGLNGSMKDYLGVGTTIDCMAGIASLTGYEKGGPRLQPNAYGDPVGGLNGAIAVMMALRHRAVTGKGRHIEIALLESSIHHVAIPFMDYVMNKNIQQRIGNRHPYMAPHGCYKCKGKDQWVNISIGTDQQWESLCKVMDNRELMKTSLFSDALSRWHNQDKLNSIIEAWTLKYANKDIADLLQKANVPAGVLLNNQEIAESAHLKTRGFFEEIDRQYVGKHFYPGFVPRFSKTPGKIRKAAPCLGEDNYYIFGSLLGMTEKEIKGLENSGVIGTTSLM